MRSSKILSGSLLLASVALFSAVFNSCGVEKPAQPVKAIAIIPKPASLEATQGTFTIDEKTTIYVRTKDAQRVAEYLSEFLGSASGFDIRIAQGNAANENAIVLDLQDGDKSNEAYELAVNENQINIRSSSAAGLFYGVQTLRQLLPGHIEQKNETIQLWQVPAVLIRDQPKHSWRGMHLDVSRHFFAVDFVKQFIDRLALYKFNKLHLHLTDDQGWRLQINKYPVLTDRGAWRIPNNQDSVCMRRAAGNSDFALPEEFFKEVNGVKMYGGFYTQQDIQEIVKYATERFVTIVPEIDMPGHMNAAIDAFPDLTCVDAGGWGKLFSIPLCPCEEKTYEFITNVLSETAQLFPGEYIHIGADEVDETSWLKSPACKSMMQKSGMKSTKELHSYFVNRVNKIVQGLGKKTIGWDEITDGKIDSSITVMFWRGWVPDAPARAARNGNEVVMSPTSHCYFDYEPDHTTLERMHAFDPVPDSLESSNKIIGVQANIWTEYIPTPARLDYMTMPRMVGLAEVGWGSVSEWSEFSNRVIQHYPRWDEMKISYRLPDLEGVREQMVFIDQTRIDLSIPAGVNEIRYTTDGAEPTGSSTVYTEPLVIDSAMTLKLLTLGHKGRYGNRYTIQLQKQNYLVPAVNIATEQGISCQYYEGEYSSVSKIDEKDLKQKRNVNKIEIPSFARPSVFGIVFTGYIDVAAEGIYTFYLSSDDGSVLQIGDRVVVDNDGYHGDREAVGQVALGKGLHPFTLRYFDGGGGNSVGLKYDGPGITKQELPSGAFRVAK